MMKSETRFFGRLTGGRALRLVALGGLLLFAFGALPSARAQEPQNKTAAASGGFQELIAALKASPGCLGVETAITTSRKQVVFAWFENKQAVLKWYYSKPHRQAQALISRGDNDKPDTPLAGVPDDVGPVMVVASITLGGQPAPGTKLAFSQIAIELYQPLTGGIFVGSRFAPDALKLPHMKDYTPKQQP